MDIRYSFPNITTKWSYLFFLALSGNSEVRSASRNVSFLWHFLTCKISKKGIFYTRVKKKNFCLSWGMKALMPTIHDRICSMCSTADITVILSSKLSTLRSTFGRVPVHFFNCSGWNSFNFYIYFWISLKNFTDLDVWAPFRPRLFLHFRQK